jgi:hypothetical protein
MGVFDVEEILQMFHRQCLEAFGLDAKRRCFLGARDSTLALSLEILFRI